MNSQVDLEIQERYLQKKIKLFYFKIDRAENSKRINKQKLLGLWSEVNILNSILESVREYSNQ